MDHLFFFSLGIIIVPLIGFVIGIRPCVSVCSSSIFKEKRELDRNMASERDLDQT